MDNLLACESAAGHGSGQLTKAEVMNCYLQFSRGSASSLSIIGNANNSPGNAGSGSGSGSTSTTHHAGSSTTHHADLQQHIMQDLRPHTQIVITTAQPIQAA